MSRIQLTDGSGRWFDSTRAEKWEEGTYWDGNNRVSLSAGKHSHEVLYRTAGGRWVLHRWSQWQGVREMYEEIDNEAAARWLSINEHEPHEECAKEFAALEIQ